MCFLMALCLTDTKFNDRGNKMMENDTDDLTGTDAQWAICMEIAELNKTMKQLFELLNETRRIYAPATTKQH